jgi:hypothetical protein
MFSSCLNWTSIYTTCSDSDSDSDSDKQIEAKKREKIEIARKDVIVSLNAYNKGQKDSKATRLIEIILGKNNKTVELRKDNRIMDNIHDMKLKEIAAQEKNSDGLILLQDYLRKFNATEDMTKLLETCYRRESKKKWTMTKSELDIILDDDNLNMKSDEKKQLLSQFTRQQASVDPPKNKDKCKYDSLLFLSKDNNSLTNYITNNGCYSNCCYSMREIQDDTEPIRNHLKTTERMDIIPYTEYSSYLDSYIIFFDDEDHENDPKFDVLYRRINDYYFVSNNEYFQKCSDYYFKLYSNIFALVDLQKITMKYHSGESTDNKTNVSLNTYVVKGKGSVESSHNNTADKEITMEFENKEGKRDWINSFNSCDGEYEQILQIKRDMPTSLQKPMYHIQSNILGLIRNYTEHNLIKFEQEQTIENTDIKRVESSLDIKFNIGASIGLFGNQSNSRYVHQSVVYKIEFFSKNHNNNDAYKRQVGFTDKSSIAPSQVDESSYDPSHRSLSSTSIPTGATSSPTSIHIDATSSPTSIPIDATSSPICTPIGTTSTPMCTPIDATSTPMSTPIDATSSPMTTPIGTTSSPMTTPIDTTSSPMTTPIDATSSPMTTPIDATSIHTHTYMSTMKPPSENNISQSEPLPVSEPEPERELKWVSRSRLDAIPKNAICTGSFKTDGEVYIGRIKVGPGKVNLDNGKIWNYWVQNTGSSQSGQVLVCDYPCKWVKIKRGGTIPQDAVYSGKDKRNDHVWVGKSQNHEPGKITCIDNNDPKLKMANLWCHSAWGSYQEAYILTVIGYAKHLILEKLEEG